MPRLGHRQVLTLELARASTYALSGIFSTAQPPSYVGSYACLHFDLINTTALMLLDFEDTFILGAISLVRAFNNFVKTTSDLEVFINSQLAIHQHVFNVALAISNALEDISRLRYIDPRIHIRLTTIQQLRFEKVFDGGDRNFLRYARISRSNFDILVNHIRHDLVFHNGSSAPQMPVEWQLLVTLCRLGSSGNGSSAYMIGQLFAISEGSVHNFTKRCFEAILKMEKEFVYWPNQDERNRIKAHIGSKSFFKDCVGFIDGTLIPLAFAPTKDPEDFWTRKHNYALNTMLVSDHRGKIIYYLHGWCGSVHDQRIYASSQLAQHPQHSFGENEYILADSGYTCSQHVIPTFKSPRLQLLDIVRREFNQELSEQRVVSEHSNGQLKLRFQSLQSLRILIKDSQSAELAVEWLKVCCILHNFAITFRDQWIPDSYPSDHPEAAFGEDQVPEDRGTSYQR